MNERILSVFAIAWIFSAVALAGDHDKKCNGPECSHCMVPPPPFCPQCTNPCDECRLCLCPPWNTNEARIWIEKLLHCPNFQGRKKAAAKLGCRWHADFCQTPEVLTVLIGAMHCDACWEVRQTAATAIRQQNARTPQAILSLFLASRLDPHYLVRERANESLEILLILQRPCYKQLLKDAEELVKKLRDKYKPGTHDCQTLYSLCGQVLNAKGGTTTSGTTSSRAGEGGEDALPGPTNLPSEAEGKTK